MLALEDVQRKIQKNRPGPAGRRDLKSARHELRDACDMINREGFFADGLEDVDLIDLLKRIASAPIGADVRNHRNEDT